MDINGYGRFQDALYAMQHTNDRVGHDFDIVCPIKSKYICIWVFPDVQQLTERLRCRKKERKLKGGEKERKSYK